jgi:hypothetical protein
MRIRFSIRDLLLLLIIVALALGQWLGHRRLTRRFEPSDEWLNTLVKGAKQCQNDCTHCSVPWPVRIAWHIQSFFRIAH